MTDSASGTSGRNGATSDAGAMPPLGSFVKQLVVSRVIDETADARSVVFTIPADEPGRFSYQPGQFLTLRIPSTSTGSVARCYSLSSSPHTDRELIVTVKRTRDGYGSNWLCDNAEAGMRMHVLAPSGTFVPKSLDTDFLLLGAGSGITPLMAIVKSVLNAGTGSIVLVYANRDPSSVIFAKELAELEEKSPDRLTVLHWFEDERGLPTSEKMAELLTEYSADREAFICGPGPFMSLATSALNDLGVPQNRVHVEVFQSLEGDPFAAVELSSESHSNESDATAVVNLDGAQYEVSWPRDTPLLDVLLNEGIDAPFSCREGSCSSCACLVLSGEAEMILNDVLDEDELSEGLHLACQLLPKSDRLEIGYPD